MSLARIDTWKTRFPEKFVAEERIFSHIHKGNRIFVGTGCGEPQFLVRALIQYVESNPTAIFDAEVFIEVLAENRPMLHLFDKMGFDIKRRREEGVYELQMMFR